MDHPGRRPAPDTESMERAPYTEPVLELKRVYATAVSLLLFSLTHPAGVAQKLNSLREWVGFPSIWDPYHNHHHSASLALFASFCLLG